MIKSILFFENNELQNRCSFLAKINSQELVTFIAQKTSEFIEQKYGQKMSPKTEADFYIICKGYANKEKNVSVAQFIEKCCAEMIKFKLSPTETVKTDSKKEKKSSFFDLNKPPEKETT